MRFLCSSLSRTKEKLAFVGAQVFLAQHYSSTAFSAFRSRGYFPSSPVVVTTTTTSSSTSSSSTMRSFSTTTTSTMMASVGGNGDDGPTLTHIGLEEMEEIIEDYETGGREDSGYIVMDVRETHEIESSGKVSLNTHTLPLSVIGQQEVFSLDDDEFEIICGFTKPAFDETLVFTCAAGIRSVNACSFAAQSGYTKLVNYKGGAYEWFTRRP